MLNVHYAVDRRVDPAVGVGIVVMALPRPVSAGISGISGRAKFEESGQGCRLTSRPAPTALSVLLRLTGTRRDDRTDDYASAGGGGGCRRADSAGVGT
jgi:hypothetical protein